MFEQISIEVDFKDLSNIKTSLELHIEDLKSQNFGDHLKDDIEEYEDLLSRIDKEIKKHQF